jgi:hypothetical protein
MSPLVGLIVHGIVTQYDSLGSRDKYRRVLPRLGRENEWLNKYYSVDDSVDASVVIMIPSASRISLVP